MFLIFNSRLQFFFISFQSAPDKKLSNSAKCVVGVVFFMFKSTLKLKTYQFCVLPRLSIRRQTILMKTPFNLLVGLAAEINDSGLMQTLAENWGSSSHFAKLGHSSGPIFS